MLVCVPESQGLVPSRGLDFFFLGEKSLNLCKIAKIDYLLVCVCVFVCICACVCVAGAGLSELGGGV